MVILFSASLSRASPLILPFALASTTVPAADAPLAMTVLPPTATGSATVASNGSPVWLVFDPSPDERRTVMTVPAGITTGFGGGGGGAGAGAGATATGAAEVSGGFKSAEEFPAWAEDAPEFCVCFVLSSAGADVGSDFLAQAMVSESSATNNIVAFTRVIVILFTWFSFLYFTLCGNKLRLAVLTDVGLAGRRVLNGARQPWLGRCDQQSFGLVVLTYRLRRIGSAMGTLSRFLHAEQYS
jgi:hypothetical protein